MTFAIYETATGIVRGFISVSHPDDDAVAANTPEGCSALDVTAPSGTPIGNGWQIVNGALVQVAPSDAALLASAQQEQVAVIESAYQVATYETPVPYMGTSFVLDADKQTMLTGAITVLSAPSAPAQSVTWWDVNNVAVSMNLAQLQGFGLAALVAINTSFGRRKARLASIAAATTVAEVQAIVW